ncbi:hypothetical protein PRBEI_2000482400 [Prionailurus iriomotensis]
MILLQAGRHELPSSSVFSPPVSDSRTSRLLTQTEEQQLTAASPLSTSTVEAGGFGSAENGMEKKTIPKGRYSGPGIVVSLQSRAVGSGPLDIPASDGAPGEVSTPSPRCNYIEMEPPPMGPRA